MVAVAIGGAAVLGAGASIIGGNKAAKAQQKGADQASATERYMYDTTRADYAPWRAAGATALTALMNLYGLPAPAATPAGSQTTPETGAARRSGRWFEDSGDRAATATPTPAPAAPVGPYGGLRTSPGYQFRLDEGIKAIDRSASARGLRRSGGTAMAVQRYGEGLAASEYDSYASRLAQLSGFGQSATAGTAAAGASAAQAIGNAQMAAGNARASSYLNTASSINSGLNNAVTAYGYGKH